MQRSAGLVAAAVVCVSSLVSIAMTACGSTTDRNIFGSSGTSGEDVPSTSGGLFDGSVNTPADSGKTDECKKMDIVFVVDNSGSMKEEQTNLATNFPKFVSVIDNYKTKSGESLDYRVAVTSTDVSRDKGAFRSARAPNAPPGCSAGPARPWLERADGDVSRMFGCRAQLGTGGSSTEQPLASMLLSVTSNTANAASGVSFVREDALLAFIVITDEDERPGPGARPIGEYPAAFDKVKGDRARWAAAVIAGPAPCSSPGFGSAEEAKDLKRFIADVGKNGVFSSICAGDLTTALSEALTKFDQACRDFPGGPVK